jgi:hypothetical protein
MDLEWENIILSLNGPLAKVTVEFPKSTPRPNVLGYGITKSFGFRA